MAHYKVDEGEGAQVPSSSSDDTVRQVLVLVAKDDHRPLALTACCASRAFLVSARAHILRINKNTERKWQKCMHGSLLSSSAPGTPPPTHPPLLPPSFCPHPCPCLPTLAPPEDRDECKLEGSAGNMQHARSGHPALNPPSPSPQPHPHPTHSLPLTPHRPRRAPACSTCSPPGQGPLPSTPPPSPCRSP